MLCNPTFFPVRMSCKPNFVLPRCEGKPVKMFSFLPALILAGVALPQATQGISSIICFQNNLPTTGLPHFFVATLLSVNDFLVSTLPFPVPLKEVIVDINSRPLTKLDFTDLCSNYSLSGGPTNQLTSFRQKLCQKTCKKLTQIFLAICWSGIMQL